MRQLWARAAVPLAATLAAAAHAARYSSADSTDSAVAPGAHALAAPVPCVAAPPPPPAPLGSCRSRAGSCNLPHQAEASHPAADPSASALHPWLLLMMTRARRAALPSALAEAPPAPPPPPSPPPPPPLAAAYRASLLSPLSWYRLADAPSGLAPPSAQALREMEAAALAGWAAGQPLQVVTVAWALAWAGHQPGPEYLQRLQSAAASGSLPGPPSQPPLGATQRAVLLWCAAMHGVAAAPVWEAGLRALAPAALDDAALLYLMHAALLVAADVAAPARRSGSTGVSPASPTAAAAAAAADQPRATREEVLAAAAPLGRKGLARLAAAYGEFVPLHPAVEGPYLVLLYVMAALAAEAEGGGRAGGGGPWVPPGAAQAAAAMLGSVKDLARLRRDLLYHWRGDQLLGPEQEVRNQLVYLLTRRLGVAVAQPDDVDVLVPSRRLAIYVRATAAPAAEAAEADEQAAAVGSGAGGAGGAAPASAGAPLALKALSEAAGEGVELLLRDRFAPRFQPGGAQGQGVAGVAASCGPPGMWAGRERQLRRLGWRTAVVDAEQWAALPGDAAKEAYLARLLRGGAGG